jgi:SHS2 domain-containing protein
VKTAGFEEVAHTADVALRVWGRDLAELFASAARGLAYLIADLSGVTAAREEKVSLRSFDAESLLVAWLSELLYLTERDGVVFIEFDMQKVTPTELVAVARGGAPAEWRREVKAVTFSDLRIVRTEDGYTTTLVFDV